MPCKVKELCLAVLIYKSKIKTQRLWLQVLSKVRQTVRSTRKLLSFFFFPNEIHPAHTPDSALKAQEVTHTLKHSEDEAHVLNFF